MEFETKERKHRELLPRRAGRPNEVMFDITRQNPSPDLARLAKVGYSFVDSAGRRYTVMRGDVADNDLAYLKEFTSDKLASYSTSDGKQTSGVYFMWVAMPLWLTACDIPEAGDILSLQSNEKTPLAWSCEVQETSTVTTPFARKTGWVIVNKLKKTKSSSSSSVTTITKPRSKSEDLKATKPQPKQPPSR
jgi:hypothetical protein